MNPIGNDIVDLKAPGAADKSRDFRFMNRVLGPDEQRAVAVSTHPDRLLWAYWAAREAAYKAVSKLYPEITSAPRRYPVVLDLIDAAAVSDGTVHTPAGPVAVRIHFAGDHVHCIGMVQGEQNLDEIKWRTGVIPPGNPENVLPGAHESEFVRKLAKAHIAQLLGVSPDDIDIIRHQTPRGPGPPVVRCGGRTQKIDISLSHDGRFVAWACLT